MTFADFERESRAPYDRTLADIRRTLEAAGVEFTNVREQGKRSSAGRDSELRRGERVCTPDEHIREE
jgi:hypothetical protein